MNMHILLTEEKFRQLRFRMVSHLALESEHCSVYTNDTYKISVCRHVLKKKDGNFGRSYDHYMYNGKVYKTFKRFLDAYNAENN